MSLSAPAEVVLEQDDALDVLCCALDAGPLTIAQLSARTGKLHEEVWWWVTVALMTAGLMRDEDKTDCDEHRYVLDLDDQPPAVRVAIEAHRRG